MLGASPKHSPLFPLIGIQLGKFPPVSAPPFDLTSSLMLDESVIAPLWAVVGLLCLANAWLALSLRGTRAELLNLRVLIEKALDPEAARLVQRESTPAAGGRLRRMSVRPPSFPSPSFPSCKCM